MGGEETCCNSSRFPIALGRFLSLCNLLILGLPPWLVISLSPRPKPRTWRTISFPSTLHLWPILNLLLAEVPTCCQEELRLGLQEALVNAAKHGNCLDPNKVICIRFARINRRCWWIIGDQGRGFTPKACAAPWAEPIAADPAVQATPSAVENPGAGQREAARLGTTCAETTGLATTRTEATGLEAIRIEATRLETTRLEATRLDITASLGATGLQTAALEADRPNPQDLAAGLGVGPRGAGRCGGAGEGERSLGLEEERDCGRGIFLMQHIFDEVRWNPEGNELTLCKHLPRSIPLSFFRFWFKVA